MASGSLMSSDRSNAVRTWRRARPGAGCAAGGRPPGCARSVGGGDVPRRTRRGRGPRDGPRSARRRSRGRLRRAGAPAGTPRACSPARGLGRRGARSRPEGFASMRVGERPWVAILPPCARPVDSTGDGNAGARSDRRDPPPGAPDRPTIAARARVGLAGATTQPAGSTTSHHTWEVRTNRSTLGDILGRKAQ